MLSKRAMTRFLAFSACLLLGTAYAADYFGVWSGNWEGGGAGGSIVITLTSNGGKVGGKVDVGQDTGDYSATFSTATLEGGKFKARYEYTPDPQAEIVLEGQFEGTEGKGTWTMVQKGGDEAFLAGSWTATKK